MASDAAAATVMDAGMETLGADSASEITGAAETAGVTGGADEAETAGVTATAGTARPAGVMCVVACAWSSEGGSAGCWQMDGAAVDGAGWATASLC